jgi:hypothetical protein
MKLKTCVVQDTSKGWLALSCHHTKQAAQKALRAAQKRYPKLKLRLR